MRGITNARPKDGVQTINNLAPDGNGNFTIEAGTGVTITPGTNKITIGASGGGEWTKRANNNDWSDLFEISGTTIKFKKNTMIFYNNSTFFFPKNFEKTGQIYLSWANIAPTATNNRISYMERITLIEYSSSLTVSTLSSRVRYLDFTTDGTTVSISSTTGGGGTVSKSNLTIYTMD